jgi:hypothetical protein
MAVTQVNEGGASRTRRAVSRDANKVNRHCIEPFSDQCCGRSFRIISVGALHSWRVIYMDGRSHPENPEPTWDGHSVGHWERDTAAIDSVGFNQKFRMSRLGPPHTSQFHAIERISRQDFNTIEV